MRWALNSTRSTPIRNQEVLIFFLVTRTPRGAVAVFGASDTRPGAACALRRLHGR
jgi:hypothetical protein